jgi:hypothetical protein
MSCFLTAGQMKRAIRLFNQNIFFIHSHTAAKRLAMDEASFSVGADTICASVISLGY